MDGRGLYRTSVALAEKRRPLTQTLRDGTEAKAGIGHWIALPNNCRLHQALGYRATMAVWREDMAGAKALDLMDYAAALTTCPQPQQQTEPLAAR
jgi:putative transposase